MKKFFTNIFKAAASPKVLAIGFVVLITAIVIPKEACAFSVVSISSSVLGWIMGVVLLPLISGVLGLAGLLLDKTIQLSVIDLNQNLSTISGINTAWTLIRDLCNMSFIFILVYYAVMMIFGGKDARKIIAPIIIAAVLINFSLFFTKVIIDASNVVASSFYNSLEQSAGQGSILGISDDYSLSLAIMKDLHITSLYDPKNITVSPDQGGAYLLTVLGASIFMLAAIFILVAMSVLFFIRYLIFIFLLILSPFGYVASAIPGTKDISGKFWKTLTGQALFAPIFMIMIWITLTLASSLTLGAGTGQASLSAAFSTPSSSTVGPLLNFVLLIGMLIFSMIVSKQFATQGGLVSGKIVDKATGFAGSALFGGAAFVGRGTLGARANTLAQNEDLKRKAAEGNKFAQAKLKTYNTLAKGTFDARRSKIGEQIQESAGIKLGKGTIFNEKAGKDGYVGRIKEKAEKEKKYAESLKPSDEAVAKAKDTLKDKEFLAGEKERVEAKNQKLDREIDEEKNNSPEILQAESEKNEADKELKNLQGQKKTSDEKIKDLEEKMRTSTIVGAKDTYQKQINEEKQTLEALNATIAAAEQTSTKKNEAFTKAMEPLKDLLDKRAENISDELKQTIATAGGSKAVEKELKDAQITVNKPIENEKNIRIENYAKTFDKKTVLPEKRGPGWAIFKGNPQLNKSTARSIRSAAKGKSAEQEMEDILKKLKKQKDDAEGKKDEGDGEEKKSEGGNDKTQKEA